MGADGPGHHVSARMADSPTDEAGAQYHLRLSAGQMPTDILMPGDPGRVEAMRLTWDDGVEVAYHRGFRSARGLYKGIPVGAISSGIGGPSLEIAVQEFAAVGGRTVIRVGTCGALPAGIGLGDIVIPAAAVRRDGASDRYLTPEHPAFADPEVYMALVEACERLGVRYHVGIACSTGSFYLGQGRPVHGGFWRSDADALVEDLRQAGVSCFEMECSALFVLARLMGMRSGAVLGVVANRATNSFGDSGAEARAIAVGNEALAVLDGWRRLRETAGKPNFYPSLLVER